MQNGLVHGSSLRSAVARRRGAWLVVLLLCGRANALQAQADDEVVPATATPAPEAAPEPAAAPEAQVPAEAVETERADADRAVPAPVAENGAGESGGGDQEMVITARRRKESLQRAPVAVTVFSEHDLAARNVTATTDLSRFTPNLQLDGSAALSGSSSNATAFIRGIGQNDFAIFSDPGIGLYVDDVYLGRSMGGVLDVVDLQSVQVLRGPQGTLFGRNTIGGAVLLTSRRPSFDPEGQIELTGGSFYRTDIKAGFNAPIVENKLALRVSAASLKRDGYGERLVDHQPLGDINRFAGRMQLLWVPTDDIEVLVSADATRAREHSAVATLVAVTAGGFPFQNIFNTLVAPNAGITTPASTLNASFITGNPFKTYATGPNVSDLDSWGVSLTPLWEINENVSLKSISAYRSLVANFGRDGDNTPFSFRETLQDNDQWQFSQELQLLGNAIDKRLEWIVGGYYFEEHADEKSHITLADGIFQALQGLPGPQAFPPGGPPAPACMAMPPAMGCFGGAGNPANVGADLVIDLQNHIKNRALAGFGHASFHIVEGLSLAAGLRATHEAKDFSLVHRRVASGAYIAAPGSEFSDSWTSVDPQAGLQFQATKDILAYFTWSRGFKSGGRNGRPLVNVTEVTRYEPETLWSYELGVKTEWLDRVLSANLAGFYYDYRNIQLTVNQTPQNFVDNAARARLFGAEAELRARPVRSFQLSAALGYLNAAYLEVGSPVDPMRTLPITTKSKLPKAPNLTLSGGVEYTLDLPDESGSIVLRGDIAFRSKVYNDVANNELLAQAAFALIGARVSWFSQADDWELALFATNLTDERYKISGNAASPAFGVAEASYGRPREFGATVKRRF